MSQIHISHPHGVSRKTASKLIKKFVEDLEDEYDFEGEWDGHELLLTRTGAKGAVRVLDDVIEVDVKLGVLLKPLSKKIEHRILAQLDELFPNETV